MSTFKFPPLTGIVILLLFGVVQAVHIPGWSRWTYSEGETVPLFTNKVTSDSTRLPYAFSELPFFCNVPDGSRNYLSLNIGEILRGDRVSLSNHKLEFKHDNSCQQLCTKSLDKKAINKLARLIHQKYNAEWFVDDLPGATSYLSPDKSKKYYVAGFPLGYEKNGVQFVYNHLQLVLRYNEDPYYSGRYYIVGFEVYPKSISDYKCINSNLKLKSKPLGLVMDPLSSNLEITIPFTYSVYWREESDMAYEDRWKLYYLDDERTNHAHWLSIINSLAIASFLAVIVGVVLGRTLYRDISNYNTIDESDLLESNKDLFDNISRWKLLTKDVFRTPSNLPLFAALIGSGVQLITMTISVIILSSIGILNPTNRGGLQSFGIFSFAFAGIISGYVSARRLRDFQGTIPRSPFLSTLATSTAKAMPGRKRTVWLTASLVPGIFFSIFMILNLFVWHKSSSSAVPFGSIIALLAIWLLISLPLVYIGFYQGYKHKPMDVPSKPTSIARWIPNQKWYLKTPLLIVIGGIPPFLVIFVELIFIFNAMWNDKTSFYYMYGFFLAVVFVLIITVIETSIVLIYFQLSHEDHRWPWRSFWISTGTGWWIFGYSIYYFCTNLQIEGLVSVLIFMGYSAMICIGIGLITGSIGHLATSLFVYKIYGAIKED